MRHLEGTGISGAHRMLGYEAYKELVLDFQRIPDAIVDDVANFLGWAVYCESFNECANQHFYGEGGENTVRVFLPGRDPSIEYVTFPAVQGNPYGQRKNGDWTAATMEAHLPDVLRALRGTSIGTAVGDMARATETPVHDIVVELTIFVTNTDHASAILLRGKRWAVLLVPRIPDHYRRHTYSFAGARALAHYIQVRRLPSGFSATPGSIALALEALVEASHGYELDVTTPVSLPPIPDPRVEYAGGEEVALTYPPTLDPLDLLSCQTWTSF